MALSLLGHLSMANNQAALQAMVLHRYVRQERPMALNVLALRMPLWKSHQLSFDQQTTAPPADYRAWCDRHTATLTANSGAGSDA